MSLTSIPFIFICFVIFCIVSSVLRRKANKQEDQNRDDLMNAERLANETRPVDLSTLSYIEVPTSTLPFGSTDPEIKACEDTVLALSKEKLLNLNSMTNTEIKMSYGVANLEALSKCDDNYSELIITLNKWGQLLSDLARTDEAIAVLSYAVSIGSDIKSTYSTLGDLYFSKGAFDRIDLLIASAEALDSINKTAILNTLQSY